MKKRFLTVLLLLCSASIVHAEMKQFVREYTYRAGEADSKITSRRMATRSVREELLGEIGTYIYSEMTVAQSSRGKDMTQHDVKALTAGFVKIEILEEKWDGYEYHVKALCEADVDKVLKNIENFQANDDEVRQAKEQLLEAQQNNEKLLRELKILRREIETSKGESPQFVEKKIEDYQKAQQFLSAAEMVDKGNTLYFLGKPNYNEAYQWYLKAAKQGDKNAQANLGFMLLHGRGVEQNDKEAAGWFVKASEQGHAKAQAILGLCYSEGRGVAKDDQLAIKWYRSSAKAGYAPAQYALGVVYTKDLGDKKSMAEAVKLFHQSAEKGFVKAHTALGIAYAKGQGVKKNFREAVKWLRKAADQGEPSGQFALSLLYAKGQGVKKSSQETVKWLRKAADQGEPNAQFALGVLYAKGQGVKKSSQEAVKWFRKAAEQELPQAKQMLAKIAAHLNSK